ncbi:hypothetical protein Cch01nite_19970 [Cellulomonas chitinilytica]|uniref:Uncharacterized protein n=1 Tax=Cellulomonas chitinilytica TaxID=398759 RepID=A0A919P0X4_9CELL|nr:hypothetical protein Cch01nite_19970 [Cellulomonas chitinilytica]
MSHISWQTTVPHHPTEDTCLASVSGERLVSTFLTDSRRAAPPRAVGLPGGAPRSARKLAARTPPVQPTTHDESGPEPSPEPLLPTADLHRPDRPAPHRPPIVRPSPARIKGAYGVAPRWLRHP